MKYFIDDNVWYQGKRQPPRKVELVQVWENEDGKTACCYDKDGDSYTLNLCDILDDDMRKEDEGK